MEKKIIITSIGIITLLVGLFSLGNMHTTSKEKSKTAREAKKLEAVVLYTDDTSLTIQDENNIIYTIGKCQQKMNVGDRVLLKYTGLLNKDMEQQSVMVMDCDAITTMEETNFLPEWNDQGMFQKFYKLAYEKVKNLSLDEKIAQLLLVRYPDSNATEILKKYQFGGYVFFARDFSGKDAGQVKQMMASAQGVAKIPILTAVDEEGGSVVRISSNPKLASQKFESPSALYRAGGFPRIKQDTIQKSALLQQLGINLNLAPVVDVATDSNSYMYPRTLGENTELTSTYAKTVIEASKGTNVSYTLKHFPGYGNNADTHTGSTTDNRTYDDILNNDLPPFEAGIAAGAEAVLVSHNTVTSIDSNNPASLSPSVHNLLRNRLDFTGIIITDDLSMGATSAIDEAPVKAILAGNDLIISTDYQIDITKIRSAVMNGTLDEGTIEKLAMRIVAWKYYKGLIIENQK